jgi:DNA-directed RNA polymerase specialized sigma24 family protein
MEESDLREWLLAARESQTDAYTRLFPRVFAWVFRIALKILRNAAQGEDAAAAVMAKLYIHRSEYDATMPAKPWVRTFTVNECLDAIRNETRHPGEDIEDVKFQDQLAVAPIAIKRISDKELIAAVINCWSKLSALRRAALAATVFGLANAEVKDKRLHRETHRARNNLRDCLRKAGHEFSEKGTSQ